MVKEEPRGCGLKSWQCMLNGMNVFNADYYIVLENEVKKAKDLY